MTPNRQYTSLPAFSANPDPPIISNNSSTIETPKRDHRIKHKLKVERRRRAKREARLEHLCEHYFLDAAIDVAEYERTTMTKENIDDSKRRAVDSNHSQQIKPAPRFIQSTEGNQHGAINTSPYQACHEIYQSRQEASALRDNDHYCGGRTREPRSW